MRPLLNETTPSVAERQAGFHADVVGEVARTVSSQPVVVVGMSMNPHVARARKALQAAGVDFTYLEYGGYHSQWKPRLAIKMWSGWPTFPQVFVKGALIGGADETDKALADGTLKGLLAG
jgi:glutaredoxin-related protein